MVNINRKVDSLKMKLAQLCKKYNLENIMFWFLKEKAYIINKIYNIKLI